jgi:hypothetical protein
MARKRFVSQTRRLATFCLALLLTPTALNSVARAETPELVEGAAAVAYLNLQRQANGIPPFSKEEASLASWCPNERGGVGGSPNRVLSPIPYWDAAISPWAPVPYAPAPFHQALIYDAVYTTVGEVNAEGPYNGEGPVLNAACASVAGERPAPSTPEGAVFYSALGASHVPPAVIAVEDFTPAQALGLPAKTGPNLIAYAIPTGIHLRLPYAPHATVIVTLTSASGETVPNIAAVAGADCFIIVPPPLQPNTEYSGEALISINAFESVSNKLRFSTGPEELLVALTGGTAQPGGSPLTTSNIEHSVEVGKRPMGAARPTLKIKGVHATRTTAVVTIALSQPGRVVFRGVAFRTTVRTLASGLRRVVLKLTQVGQSDRKHHKKAALVVTLKVGAVSASTSDRIKL